MRTKDGWGTLPVPGAAHTDTTLFPPRTHTRRQFP